MRPGGACALAAWPLRGILPGVPLLTFARGGAGVVSWHPPGSVVAPRRLPRQREGCRGKPMPAAGETAHVRRLLVDRSRCGLEVSPAPPGDPTSPGEGEGQ